MNPSFPVRDFNGNFYVKAKVDILVIFLAIKHHCLQDLFGRFTE